MVKFRQTARWAFPVARSHVLRQVCGVGVAFLGLGGAARSSDRDGDLA